MIDIKIGDARELINEYDDNTFDCVMTSPPYWGLRDYGYPDQIGMESTPEEYLSTMLDFFDDVYLKLKDTGNCFVNLGDTYSGSGGAGGDYNNGGLREDQPKYKQNNTNLKPKCLCMIPERFAWGMIERGWILRNKIIWWKPNHMPESVTDRFTKSHEVIWYFTKQGKYYFDLDAVRQKHIWADKDKRSLDGLKHKSKGKCQEQRYSTDGVGYNPKGKNPGDVWSINTRPYNGAHFAVFPIELVRCPILAGCPEGGHVLDPFGGSGTVAEFCRKNDRNCTIFELNPEYKPLIQERSMQHYPDITTF